MKERTVYVCEICDYESENYHDMKEHEASHLGLTVEELHDYNVLKSHAQYMGIVVSSITNNDETRAKFDRAIEDLIAFEREHNLLKEN